MTSDYVERLRSTEPQISDEEIDRKYETGNWKYGDHSMKPTLDADELRETARKTKGVDDEMANIVSKAADRLDEVKLFDFECSVEHCSQSHGHFDKKHDIRRPPKEEGAGKRHRFPGFNVRPEFADNMTHNPACHCGVNELAVIVDFIDDLGVNIFTDQDELDEREMRTRTEAIRKAASKARINGPTESAIERIRNELEDYFADDEPEAPTGDIADPYDDDQVHDRNKDDHRWSP